MKKQKKKNLSKSSSRTIASAAKRKSPFNTSEIVAVCERVWPSPPPWQEWGRLMRPRQTLTAMSCCWGGPGGLPSLQRSDCNQQQPVSPSLNADRESELLRRWSRRMWKSTNDLICFSECNWPEHWTIEKKNEGYFGAALRRLYFGTQSTVIQDYVNRYITFPCCELREGRWVTLPSAGDKHRTGGAMSLENTRTIVLSVFSVRSFSAQQRSVLCPAL